MSGTIIPGFSPGTPLPTVLNTLVFKKRALEHLIRGNLIALRNFTINISRLDGLIIMQMAELRSQGVELHRESLFKVSVVVTATKQITGVQRYGIFWINGLNKQRRDLEEMNKKSGTKLRNSQCRLETLEIKIECVQEMIAAEAELVRKRMERKRKAEGDHEGTCKRVKLSHDGPDPNDYYTAGAGTI